MALIKEKIKLKENFGRSYPNAFILFINPRKNNFGIWKEFQDESEILHSINYLEKNEDFIIFNDYSLIDYIEEFAAEEIGSNSSIKRMNNLLNKLESILKMKKNDTWQEYKQKILDIESLDRALDEHINEIRDFKKLSDDEKYKILQKRNLQTALSEKYHTNIFYLKSKINISQKAEEKEDGK